MTILAAPLPAAGRRPGKTLPTGRQGCPLRRGAPLLPGGPARPRTGTRQVDLPRRVHLLGTGRAPGAARVVRGDLHVVPARNRRCGARPVRPTSGPFGRPTGRTVRRPSGRPPPVRRPPVWRKTVGGPPVRCRPEHLGWFEQPPRRALRARRIRWPAAGGGLEPVWDAGMVPPARVARGNLWARLVTRTAARGPAVPARVARMLWLRRRLLVPCLLIRCVPGCPPGRPPRRPRRGIRFVDGLVGGPMPATTPGP